MININSNKSNQFDVIVVGSGLSGGWAAKEFTENGLNTLVLERGRDIKHGEYPTANTEPWTDSTGLVLHPKIIKENPIVSKCYAFRKETAHHFVKDKEHPYIQVKPFDWIRGYQVGGKSLMWARQVQRWSDLDFTANSLDGHGVDWPIRYKDIAPWYSYVEKFIGVSGNRDGLEQVPDGDFLPPFEFNCVESHIKSKVETNYPSVNIIVGRTTNLTKRHNERGPCMLRHKCERGCPYGGYFSANSSTIPAAHKTGYMTLRTHAVVHSIIYDETKKKATGVRVVDSKTKEMMEYYSDVIFLNAGTINTTALLLNSTSNRFPEGLGNDYDVLGRYLMDHDFRGKINADVEGFENKYYSGHKPIGGYIPRFRNFKNDKQDKFLRGYAYQFGASRGIGNLGNTSARFGKDFKENLIKLGPWSTVLGPMGEQLPYHNNRVSLNKNQKDAWGIPLIEIDAQMNENEDVMLDDALNFGAEMLETAGCTNVSIMKKEQWNLGLGIHEMGTARMGKDPKTSMLNKYNQLHHVKNVFVTDGSCMASSACQNPSITYMAITARAANYAIQELKKRNL